MTDNKYRRGKIYKIISYQTDAVYYGSTIEEKLTNRLAGHRKYYKGWLSGKSSNFRYVTSFEIVKFDDAQIILVENYPCQTKYELQSREQHYIDKNDCINKNKAIIATERDEYKKQYNKQYREDKKEKIKQQRKQHYDDIKKEVVICECGSKFLECSNRRHFKTKKHMKYLEEKKAEDIKDDQP